MAGSYTLPQVRVFQEFAQASNDVTQNLNPFVLGPNYRLIRYSDTDERGDCRKADYSSGSVTELQWKTGYANTKVDTSWFKVTFADAYVKIGDETTAKSCLDNTTGSGNGMKFEFDLGGKSLAEIPGKELKFGVAVKPGDYVYYTSGSGASQTKGIVKIRSLSCGVPSDTEVSSKLIEKSSGKTPAFMIQDVSGYKGERTVNITVNVKGTASDMKVTWSSDSTISGPETPLTDTGINLGEGIILKKGTATTDFKAGTYVLTVKIVEPTARDTITLVSPVKLVSGSQPKFTFLRRVDAVDVDDYYLTADASKVTVDGDVKVDIGASEQKPVFSATAYLSQRNISWAHSDGVYSVGSDSDIVRELGSITPDNPLAYALHIMLLNCATANIRYIAVKSNDLEGYSDALDRASVTSEVYAFCPLSVERSIIDAVVAHCNKLSSPEAKSWRIAFFSLPTERYVDVTPNVLGVPEECRVNEKVLTCYNRGTSSESAVSHFTDTIIAGDSVTVITGSTTAVTTTVDEVTSDTTLKLKDAVLGATSNCRFTITHTREKAEYVAAIAATSSSFKDRRAYNVFPNSLRDTDGNYVSGMYASAAVCALACSVVPQQPITNVEIKGFADIPDAYSTYSKDQLNEIAAGGTLIVMQEKIGGPIYVRHQISTAYSDGNLNTTELSLTKNLDSISFYFANRFAPYIGRYNVTPALLAELRVAINDGLAYLKSTTETSRLVGPQVLADGTELRTLYQDPSEKDRVYAEIALNLPAPFNNFDLRLQVI